MRVRRNGSNRGATSVEYALLAGFIAAVVVLVIAALGVIASRFFGSGVDAVNSPKPPSSAPPEVQRQGTPVVRGWSAPHHAPATSRR